MTIDPTALDRRLRQHFDELIGTGETKGAQIYVSQDGLEVLHASYCRDDLKLPTGSMAMWSCASKPLTAVVAGRLVEAGRLSWDTDVMAVLGFSGDRLTVRDLMTHRIDFADVPTFETLHKRNLAEVAQIVLRARQPVLLPHNDTRYSSAAWIVLGSVVETITGSSLATLVEEGPLRNIPDRPCLVLPRERATSVQPPFMWRNGKLVPLKFLVGPSVAGRINPACGGYGTVRSLGIVYERLAQVSSTRATVQPSTLSAMLDAGEPRFDHHFGRECRFGMGFMRGMRSFGCGSFGPNSYGHTGWPGVYAVVEPDLAAVIVMVLYGVPRSYMSPYSPLAWELNPALDAVAAHLRRSKANTRKTVHS